MCHNGPYFSEVMTQSVGPRKLYSRLHCVIFFASNTNAVLSELNVPNNIDLDLLQCNSYHSHSNYTHAPMSVACHLILLFLFAFLPQLNYIEILTYNKVYNIMI